MRLAFAIAVVIASALIFVSRLIPPTLLLLLCTILSLLWLWEYKLDRAGSWLMVVAAVVLAFAAGSTLRRK